MKTNKIFCAAVQAAILCLIALIGCASPDNTHVDSVDRSYEYRAWLLAGQSNMVGGADADELPEALRGPQEDVPFRSYVRLVSGVTRDDGRFALQPRPTVDPSHGPEITMGRALADAGLRPYLIKYAVSGSSLAAEWRPTVEDIYPAMLAYVRAELASFPHPYRLTGVVWGQGETDAGDLGAANAYADNLRELRDRLREDLGLPNLHWISHRLHPGTRKKYVEIVRTAQEDVATDPDCGMTDIDDQLINADGLHFGSRAQQVWGARDAVAAGDVRAH